MKNCRHTEDRPNCHWCDRAAGRVSTPKPLDLPKASEGEAQPIKPMMGGAIKRRLPCIHRGKVIERPKNIGCQSCWIFECQVHGQCQHAAMKSLRRESVKSCQECEEYEEV